MGNIQWKRIFSDKWALFDSDVKLMSIKRWLLQYGNSGSLDRVQLDSDEKGLLVFTGVEGFSSSPNG